MSPFLSTLTAAAAAAVLLGACTANIPRDPASPYFQVPVGSTLQLRQKIEIPPGRTRVFLQNGAVGSGFDHYTPNCNVEVHDLVQDAVQYIEPGDYRVRRVQQTMEEVVRSRPTLVAALGRSPLLAGNEDSGGTTMIYQGYHLWLEDPADNFTRLSCRGAHANPWDARPPSIDEIRQALGEVATLLLADDPG
jgi:hypothetical protein